jgi:diphthine synthase
LVPGSNPGGPATIYEKGLRKILLLTMVLTTGFRDKGDMLSTSPILYFVGLGLSMDHITKKALNVLQNSDKVFVEHYTSFYYPDLHVVFSEHVRTKKTVFVSRKTLEDEAGKILWESLEKGENVSLAVIGDPFIATTHIALRNSAIKRGYKTSYVPGVNIYSYSISRTGLFNYKFGASSTIVYPWGNIVSTYPYKVLVENYQRGLHTFFYLDISEEKGPMNAADALKTLIDIEKREKKNVVRDDSRVVVIQHAGWPDERIVYGSIRDIIADEKMSPPHAIIFPGKLHFVEKEALEALEIGNK